MLQKTGEQSVLHMLPNCAMLLQPLLLPFKGLWNVTVLMTLHTINC